MPLLPLRLRLVSGPRLLIGLLATAAVLLAFGLFPSDARAADAPTETLELHPGDNFVGWVAEPIAVADIFEQISAATLIYTWNADSRTYRHAIRDVGGTLERLDPGMSARIRIEGRKTVKWERPLTPAKGMVTLYSGVNWVAWNGRDEWPLDQVARGIGTSLVSIEVEERGIVYQPNGNIAEAIGPLTGESTLRRGDALRVTVNRDLRWLQPTGMMPKIVWVGEISQSLQLQITNDIQHLIGFFGEEFAVETDFSDTTVMLYSSIDAAVAHEESGRDPSFGYSPEDLRGSLVSGRTAQARPWGFFMSACGWMSPVPQPCHGRTGETLMHEWFHVLQMQISGEPAWVSPVWMNEGAATWSEWQLPSALLNGTGEQARQWRLERVIQTTESLESAEDGYYGWEYDLGALAADRLADHSGADALVEYNRQLFAQAVGNERRWVRQSTWHEAFEAAFDLTVSAFYEDFAAWRETLPAPTQRKNYDPQDVKLPGTVKHSDGSAATGFIVVAEAYDGEVVVGVERSAVVDENGRFSLYLAPKTTQRVRLNRNGCLLWLTDDGLRTSPAPGQYRDLDTSKLPPLDLTLPEGACENELRAKVIRLRDDDRAVQVLLIDAENGAWSPTRLGQSGVYIGYAPEAGDYRVRIRLANCGLWYSDDGLVASSQDSDMLELSDQPLFVEFRIPHDLCMHQISGRLLYEDGTAASDVGLHVGRGDASSSLRTSAEGEFTVAVPDSGDYILSFGTDVEGCRIRYNPSGGTSVWSEATPITVSDSDVTGIEFVFPSDPSSLCE